MVRDLMDDWLEFIEGNTEDSFFILPGFLIGYEITACILIG